MKKLYSAANLPDAHIVLNLLANEGIDVRIFNQNAQGGLGEIPVNEAYPEVWLCNPKDSVRAKRILLEYQCGPLEMGLASCANCGEENPGNFQICWNCSATLPG
ncbi:MAG: DUF2007 domain-containing protein [Burkholderiales bacterium]|nr:DUF2007 domain-containing protein [Burkholderiales bacterium]MDQ3196451.1 DUF2007 domain-containing protein [Pseudomonadota bacterium]